MAQLQNHSIPRDKFLLMSANLLHRAFIGAPRTDAKNLYKAIAGGTLVRLGNVEMEDRSTLAVNLSMDHSEYRGKLNYSAFRDSLATLIGNVGQVLKEEKTYPMFGGEGGEGQMIFGIPAVTVEERQPNVMVLAAETRGAAVTLRLMYLDPAQFVPPAGDGCA